MRFDRQYQRAILTILEDAFPGGYGFEQLRQRVESKYSGEDSPDFYANVVYLQQHGLVSSRRHFHGENEEVAVITHQGIDFLADDGGLSAILQVVTVRLHEDDIKQLVGAKIRASDLPLAEKSRWLDQLRSLPGDATKHLALRLVDMGFEQGGKAAIAAIGKWLGQ